jgi:exo-beta-1,3-glucanase (GH17 family)
MSASIKQKSSVATSSIYAWARWWTHALTCMLAIAIGLPVQATNNSTQAQHLRPLPADFGQRKAVSYSPYRTAKNLATRDDETITAAMIKQDLDLLVMGRFTLIRLFDSSDKVARLTLTVIREHRMDVKVMLGIYVQHDNPSYNEQEIARGIALAREFKELIPAVSVGNETMVSWSFNRFETAAMKRYIDTVRSAVEQPVTTDDNWAFFAWNERKEQDPAAILASIDFVAMHTYPVLDSVYSPDLWDWRQASVPAPRRAAAMVSAAVARAKFEYAAVRAHMDSLGLSGMPIVIGETGWQADPAMVPFRSHPVNQKMYVDAMNAWLASGTGPRAIFHFEAFDEPWKEADDKWGLFNVKRQARLVVQHLYPRELWEPGNYRLSDAVYVTPITIRTVVSAQRYEVPVDVLKSGGKQRMAAAWKTSTKAATVSRSDRGSGVALSLQEGAAKWRAHVPVPKNQADDLSAFALGTLNFRIRTTAVTPLEIGFDVGSVSEGSALAARMPIVSGEYGYINDGAWRDVSIPIDKIRWHVAAKEKVGLSRIDLRRVTSPFVIAGHSVEAPKTGRSQISLDGVHWAR